MHATRRLRLGVTLVELLVALTLAAIVLGSATSVLLRQQRTGAALGSSVATDAQLRGAAGALAAELSVLSASAGDLQAGEARDTALQLRSLVTRGVACDDGIGVTIVAGDGDESSGALDGVVPRVGDSVWWYPGDSTRRWRSARIASSDSVTAPCRITSAPSRPARRLGLAGTDSVPSGAPLRVTRQVRYAFYRSGDGSWQLGMREWIDATARFAAPQPIAGPFVTRSGESRTGFQYFDAAGNQLPIGPEGVDIARVARLRLVVLVAAGVRALTSDSIVRDSVDIALARARGIARDD
ncbi:MAG: prepilin-type N-terminal cleavage/methylation domain-containing protein [Gemmatimonadaceae bacterium]